jgi:DNA-binding response OmpR family regulator
MMITYTGRHIVLIEDDEDYAQLVIDRLSWQGFRFSLADSGRQGISMARAQLPDLVILDLQLEQKYEGLRVLQQLQSDPATRQIPVIIHSIHVDERQLRTTGIAQGAWYCVDKNDSLSELAAAVNRVLTICAGVQPSPKRQRWLPLDYEPEIDMVFVDGVATEIKLSRNQSLLLALLVRSGGQICARDDIAREVYNSHDISNEQIDRLVSRLRDKLRDNAASPRFIEAVYGRGYRLIVTSSQEI